jgi:uncharacterized Zn finger protein
MITDRAILDWSGANEVRKGRPYADGGAVLDPVVRGGELKARVQGTADRPYRVTVKLRDGRVTDADCSCPVGDGGRCKHVAAVLLAYQASAGEFTQLEDLDADLQKRDKPELIALVKQMLRKAPELESLLAAPVPGGKRKGPVSPDVYRRQANAALREMSPDDEWAGDEADEELSKIVETGEEFEAADDWAAAAAVYQGVATAVLDDEYDLISADGGQESVPGRLAAGLLRCLDHEPAGSPRRESILRSLFDLTLAYFAWEPDPDFDPLDGMLSLITPAERRTLAGWARFTKPARDGYAEEFDRKSLARVLTRVDADVLGDEGYIWECRQAGMTKEVVDRLLALGRKDEAVREVALRVDRLHELTEFADLFVRHGLGPAAEQLVRDRAEQVEGWERVGLLEWLKKRATGPEERKLADRIFDAGPTLERYREVRRLTPAAEGPARRAAILRGLAEPRYRGLAIDIHLADEDVPAALAAAKKSHDPSRREAVAKAAEASHPAEAEALYRELAEAAIDQRNRGAYREACRFLKKAAKLGNPAEFQRYLAGVLEAHRTLRAFKEEVQKAKLVTEVPPTAVRKKGR